MRTVANRRSTVGGWRWVIAFVACLAASTAAAVGVGGALFVKAKNTRVFKDPSPTSAVIATVQPGTEVKWNGPHPKDKRYHLVELKGKTGVVLHANLTAKAPSHELTSSGNAMDPQAFANSGAATKALGDGAVAYGKTTHKEAVNQLVALEELARRVTDAEVSEHAKKAGLLPVVGPEGGQ